MKKTENVSHVDVTESISIRTFNFTDIAENSNKFYVCEICKDKSGEYWLHTQYGRTGGTINTDYRKCSSLSDAEKEAEKIIKSKIKKGYVEVKLAKADVGSEKAQEKVAIEILDENKAKKLGFEIKEETKSNLSPKIEYLMKSWFGSLQNFVTANLDTKKCSLGQLSIDQINKGRDILLEARKIVTLKKPDIQELNSLTNKFYSNIPMNFGYTRLNPDVLRLDDNDKLDKQFDLLETLEGAKDAEKVLYKKNAYDEQYKSLNTEIEWLEPGSGIYKWIETLLIKTIASNHHYLKKIRPVNVYKLSRPKEEKIFMDSINEFVKDKIHKRKELPDPYKPLWEKRFKYDLDYEGLMEAANILPLWHGTRTENMSKITGSKLLMRKPGFSVSGSMYDKVGGLYFASNSTKSAGYTSYSGSIWSGGTAKTAYLFLSDVILGKQEIATYSYPYTKQGIAPAASVWAKAKSGVLYNDEFIVYTEQQNWLRYVVEFEGG